MGAFFCLKIFQVCNIKILASTPSHFLATDQRQFFGAGSGKSVYTSSSGNTAETRKRK